MLARSNIVDELVVKLKDINGASPYTTDLYKNVRKGLKFWDEIEDFPYVCVIAGDESREYLPGNFKWGFLNINIKIYVKGEDPEELLTHALKDIEYVLDNNNELQYDKDNLAVTTAEIRILSITTDEGLLAPLGVGDMIIQVRYDL